MKIQEILKETASEGVTSSGNISSLANPQIALGNKKSRKRYGRGASPNPPKVKSVNAYNTDVSIFGGETLKR